MSQVILVCHGSFIGSKVMGVGAEKVCRGCASEASGKYKMRGSTGRAA